MRRTGGAGSPTIFRQILKNFYLGAEPCGRSTWQADLDKAACIHSTSINQPNLCESSEIFGKERSGGAEGDRTPDLVIANDALSQLSYCPST